MSSGQSGMRYSAFLGVLAVLGGVAAACSGDSHPPGIVPDTTHQGGSSGKGGGGTSGKSAGGKGGSTPDSGDGEASGGTGAGGGSGGSGGPGIKDGGGGDGSIDIDGGENGPLAPSVEITAPGAVTD